MNTDDAAIRVTNVYKTFKLPFEKSGSLKNAVVNFYSRKKGFERQQVLTDISFEIKKGEFFGIVGRNGSGKSTLLKLLAGIYSADQGTIDIAGKLTPFIELGVGFNPELTGRENVFLNGALLGFNRKEMNELYDSIVEFAELKRFMDQKLKNYSSGMQVRLAFSIAIRARSDILVLDEVLAVGDAAFQKKCYDYFMQLKKKKSTVVLVTHDMGAVRQYCDQAIMINEGKIVKVGKPEKVAQAYQKLFTDEMNQEVSDLQKNDVTDSHWGSGKMSAQSPKVKVTDKHIIIESQYKVLQDVPAPVLGFTVYGSAGNNILEGNTLRKNYKTAALKAGDTARISWSIPNIFPTGSYNISVACCDQSTTEFYDWFNDAAMFSILKDGTTAGVVDPPIEISNYQVTED